MGEPDDDEPAPVVRRAIELLREQPDLGPETERHVLARLLTDPRPGLPRRGLGHLAAIGGLALAASLAAIGLTRFGPGSKAPGLREVRFTISAAAASRVSLVGDFNNWNPAETPLRRVRATGEWSVTLPLAPGSYRFGFLLDGHTWQSDPSRPAALDPDFGTPTSVITVEHSAL
jgi:hypothetical protein